MIKKNDISKVNFFFNLLSQYGLQAAKYIIPLVSLPYLARVLGPEAYGVRTYVLSVMTMVQTFADYGFSLSATKDIVEVRNDRDAVNKIVGSVFIAKGLLSLVILLCLAMLIKVIPLLNENWLYTLIAFIAVILTSYMPDYIFMAYEKMGIITKRFIVSKVVGVILLFIFVHDSSDLLLVPLCDVISSVIAITWSIFCMYRDYGIIPMRAPFKSAFSSLKRSTIYFTTNFSSTLFNSFTTLSLGIFFKDNVGLAYWGIAISAISAVQSLYTPISNSLYPYMLSKRDLAFFRRGLALSLLPVLIGSILFFNLSELIMTLLGGREYVNGTAILQGMSPILFFSFYSIMLGWPSLGTVGLEKELAVTAYIAGAFNVISILILGISGNATFVSFALVRSIAELLLCLSRYVLACRKGILPYLVFSK